MSRRTRRPVEQVAPDRGVLGRGVRVAVAVSGGSDSVALYRLLLDQERALGIEVAGLLHVNHQLRGSAAESDEQFCRDLATSTGRAVHVERVEVDRGRGSGRRSPEDAAREARYEALERGRVALAADLVALGHTRDDQAETVLFRLLRGTGPDGLQGIPPMRGPFVRPLLGVARQALREWLGTIGQGWVEDATNADVSVPRNLLRHSVLPAIDTVFPAAARALARHAGIAREEAEWLAGLVNPAFARHVHTGGDSIRVDSALAGEPTALGRRVLLAALRAAGVRQPGLDEVEAVRELLSSPSGVCELPGGVRANRIGAAVVLTNGGGAHHAPFAGYRYSLRVPGSVEIPEASAVMGAFPEMEAPDAAPPGALDVHVDGDGLGALVSVRSWQPGDSIRPAGLGGRKKLQDVFVDGKLPRERRAWLPLVVDADDRVLWVPGLAVDERLRVTSGTRAVVVLRLTRKQMLPAGGPE